MIDVNIGQYHFSVESKIEAVNNAIDIIYGDVPALDFPYDFKVRLVFESLVRRFIKPQISFYSDQHSPFKPLPVSQAPALLEWGMNWCVAAHEYSKLIIHSAVLVKNGKAILFPALPGSGKSTLTAYLGLSSWSTYSDEMAIIDPMTLEVSPLYRPVCLKNDSISLVKKWHPKAIFTPVCKDTQKGDVAHVKVMDWQNYTQLSPVPIVAVVFPKYDAQSDLTIFQLSDLEAFNVLSKNAFNYNVLGRDGFNTVDNIIRRTKNFEIRFNDVREVDAFLTEDVLGTSL